ncbi:hypothetical protein CPB84DRAFT_1687980 [Gymnopilus junonius]|uniref:Novel STAND NTPase 1 domain-containing protein n=1 Tax=Gymnopilus junonius TaxID=109634 RepID=A0A9P5NBV3_GYMJU|nr:hypothetical protein CPB84DRAFT_1687980 [Gymnopilus junonius]
MPCSCIPRWPQAAKSQLGDNFVIQARSHADRELEVHLAKNKNGLSKPTAAEYAGEAAKEFLEVLRQVANTIPLPGLGQAVALATKIIEACEDSHATLEHAQELKMHVKTLVTLLVDGLKGKKEEEIEEKLKKDIEALQQDLTYIQRKLDEIASQHALLIIFFRTINRDKVDKCVRRLDNAMARFNVRSPLKFYSNQQKTLDSLNNGMNKVLAILNNGQPIDSSLSVVPSRSIMPANGDIFYGRDLLVEKLVHILTEAGKDGQKYARVCLLGPGGMGKTSAALAVMAHPEVRKRFLEHNQIWVPCVKAKSVSLLLDTLYSSLGTTRNSGNTLRDIISEIKASTEPLVILLDNFETPWNVIESRSETEQTLYEIDKISHVTLFITMRSSIPPCDGKHWQTFEIEAVDGDAARQIYLDISPAGNDDPMVTLLQTLGHMPLAITLMARRARMTGLGAGKLIEEYDRLGTAMLGQAQNSVDAKHSLDVCISLSVESPPMKKRPDAYELLASLAMLPVGTTYGLLTKWWVPNQPNLLDALQVLVETSLMQRRETHYFVLPVIRSYILTPSRFPEGVRIAITKSACNFLLQHNSSPGDLSFKEHADALSAEEGNLQAILLDISEADPDLIKAFLVLAKHQLSTRLRLETIEHVLKLARQMKGHPEIMGDALTCYGKMLFSLDRYDDALEQFSLAHQEFLSIPNEQQAAYSLLDKVQVSMHMWPLGISQSERLQLIMDAKIVFERLGDAQGAILCLHHYGYVIGQYGDYEEGVKLLTQAGDMFKAFPDPLNYAKCLHDLQTVYYWDENYDAALESGRAAVQELKQFREYYNLTDSMELVGRPCS